MYFPGGKRFIAICVLMAGLATSSRASWYIDSSAAAAHLGGKSRLGPYATQAEAQAVINASPNYGLRLILGGTNDVPAGGSAPGVYSSDPRLQAAGIIGNAIGQELGKALMGDPQAAAQEAQARQEAAALQVRQQQEAAALQARQQQEAHDRLVSQLRLSGGSKNSRVAVKMGDTAGGGGLGLKDLRMGENDGSTAANFRVKKQPLKDASLNGRIAASSGGEKARESASFVFDGTKGGVRNSEKDQFVAVPEGKPVIPLSVQKRPEFIKLDETVRADEKKYQDLDAQLDANKLARGNATTKDEANALAMKRVDIINEMSSVSRQKQADEKKKDDYVNLAVKGDL